MNEETWPPLMLLLEAVRAKETAVRLERDAVLAARREGMSWPRIGAALGISHQAAMKKYAALAAADEEARS